MPTASILIEVDDTGAISSFRQISAEGAKIGPSLNSASPALDKMTASSKQATESARLLGEEIGVNIPRGLSNILSQNSAIAPALSAAFSGAVVAGFIEVVKEALDQLTGFSDALASIQKQNDALLSSVGQSNKTLIGPQDLQQVDAQILKTTNYVEQLNQQIGLTGDGLGDALTRGLTKYNPAAAELVDTLDKQKGLLNDLYVEQAKLTDEQNRLDPIKIAQSNNAANESQLRGIQAITQAATDQANIVKMQVSANLEDQKVGSAEIVAIKAKETEQVRNFYEQEYDATRQEAFAAIDSGLQGQDLIDAREQQSYELAKTLLDRKLIDYNNFIQRVNSIDLEHYNDSKKLAIQQANELADAESAAAVAMVPPWERSYAQIQADTQKSLRSIQQELDNSAITSTQAAQLAADAWTVNFARTRDQLANDMETFFDDLTSGNIGQYFKKAFEDLVSQMVATWILGMSSMRSAAATGFGGGGTGILGSLFGLSGSSGGLGSLFGAGGGGVPSASIGDLSSLGLVSSLGGAGGSGALLGGDIGSLPISIPGLGLSAGQGATIGGVLPSGAAKGTGIGGLFGALGGGGLSTLLALGGLAGGTALLGSNNKILSSLGGALTGAGLGSLAGTALTSIAESGFLDGSISLGLEGILSGIGSALPIIGPIIGLLGSLLGGLFGPHTGDTARIQVMEPFLSSVKEITDSYDVFQTDYNTGFSELETLRTSSIAALKKIGGNQVKGNSAVVNSDTDAAEAHLTTTEAERARRSQIDFGPGQFHTGGYVSSSMASSVPSWFRSGAGLFHVGGEVPAILQPGEVVMQRSAVARHGVAKLLAMNAGGSGGDTHVHLSVNALDAKSFKSYLRGGGLKDIVQEWDKAARGGMRAYP